MIHTFGLLLLIIIIIIILIIAWQEERDKKAMQNLKKEIEELFTQITDNFCLIDKPLITLSGNFDDLKNYYEVTVNYENPHHAFLFPQLRYILYELLYILDIQKKILSIRNYFESGNVLDKKEYSDERIKQYLLRIKAIFSVACHISQKQKKNTQQALKFLAEKANEKKILIGVHRYLCKK